MPTKKKDPNAAPTVAPKRRPGYLGCDTCGTTIPYQGMEGSDPAMDGPRHRCRTGIRSFDRFTLDDPNRTPLPPAVKL
jgi:hypothetical protein